MSQIPFTLLIKFEQVRSFRMAATELVRLGISVVCDFLTNEYRDIIENRAIVDTEVRGMQQPRMNECASVNRNNFGP